MCEPADKAACCDAGAAGGTCGCAAGQSAEVDNRETVPAADATRGDMQAWTGCVAGALTQPQFRGALTAGGLIDVEIRHTDRAHELAGSAIVRARKPSEASAA